MIKILRWLVSNLHLKIIAILVAVAFWVYVSLDRSYQMTMELGTTPTNLKDTLVVTSPMPRVSLTFFGKGRGLLKLKIRPPLLQLNMVNARVGENIVMVPITNIFDKDQDISITKTSIREITLKVDEKAAKDIIPSIITQGQPAGLCSKRNPFERQGKSNRCQISAPVSARNPH